MCCVNIDSLVKHFDELKSEIENCHDIIRKDRNRHGGRVAFYVHKSISLSKLEEVIIQGIEALPIKIKLRKCKPFVAIAWYRLEGAVEVFKKFETLISRIDTTNVECNLMGDTNCDFIRPNNGTKHLRRLKSEKKSKVWKPENRLFCD